MRAAALVALAAAACAAPKPATSGPRAASIEVVDATSGERRFAGQPSYAWRTDQRVALLPGYGELVLGDAAGGDRCRLIVGGAGAPLVVYERRDCGVVVGKDARVCLDDAVFERVDPSVDERLVVRGCLDEGDLLWRKVDDAKEASIAPVQYHRACEAVPATRACPITYLRLDDLVIESNPDPMKGAALAYEEGEWRVCWLQAHRGGMRATVAVRTACDAGEQTKTIAR